ncbi:MAG TPA: hypothetical protein VLA13_02465 [Massilibacterium sp.]|nr:hypothetical protein [Massilibacterium sp.]
MIVKTPLTENEITSFPCDYAGTNSSEHFFACQAGAPNRFALQEENKKALDHMMQLANGEAKK